MIFATCLLFLSFSLFQADKVNAWPGQDSQRDDFVKLFDDVEFGGQSWEFPQSKLYECGCIELGDASGRVSSAHTNEYCIVLFQEPNCAGENLIMQDRSFGREDFRKSNFNDKSASFRICGCDDPNSQSGLTRSQQQRKKTDYYLNYWSRIHD